MAVLDEQGVPDRPSLCVIRWRNGSLSQSDMAREYHAGFLRQVALREPSISPSYNT